ncbi:hypothetical protein NSERUTF1_1169 [Nocardia seriolae]|nr:hypothetical protein NSERUTF1_1169 [Nocardia seriolae]
MRSPVPQGMVLVPQGNEKDPDDPQVCCRLATRLRRRGSRGGARPRR